MNALSQQTVHTARETEWIYDEPPSHLRGAKMLLLTIGKVAVTGHWTGGCGQYFAAYSPLPKVDHDKFNNIVR